MLQTFKVTTEILKEAAEAERDHQSLYIPSGECAIAKAIRVLYPNAYMGITACDMTGTADSAINVPLEVTQYVRQFDRSSYEERLEMPEFEFQLEVPDSITA